MGGWVDGWIDSQHQIRCSKLQQKLTGEAPLRHSAGIPHRALGRVSLGWGFQAKEQIEQAEITSSNWALTPAEAEWRGWDISWYFWLSFLSMDKLPRTKTLASLPPYRYFRITGWTIVTSVGNRWFSRSSQGYIVVTLGLFYCFLSSLSQS